MIAIVYRLLHYRFSRRFVSFSAGLMRRIMGSDRSFIWFIRHFLMQNSPRAASALKHYCEGGGAPVTVPLRTLLEEDEGFATYISRRIGSATERHDAVGSISVPQWGLSSLDWRLALGSFQLNWCLADGEVSAAISGSYDWHPDESRITRSVHEAADALKPEGASAYKFSSPVEILSVSFIRNQALKAIHAKDRFYM